MADDKGIVREARAYVDEVWEDVVADIDWLVQVNSVEDLPHACEGKPFGPGPYEALTRALAIAERLGLKTTDCEGYLGFGDLVGERDDVYLATIAHSDIVPVGDGWTTDPLHVVRKEGYLMGRGVLDDKGPLVLSLYAAHFFVRQTLSTGTRLPYTLRCLVGANEETGMSDVDYYLERFPQPAFCLTPDAAFPLICGEKGILHASIVSAPIAAANARIRSLEGGTAPNAVPGHAEALVRASEEEMPQTARVKIGPHGTDEHDAPVFCVAADGKGGHASMPEGTCNAIGVLVDYLFGHDLCAADERRFLEFERILHADTAGVGLGIAATDDVFDPLTCIGGTIQTQQEDDAIRFVQTVDVRYPKSTTGERVLEQLRKVAADYGCEVTLLGDVKPFYISPEAPEIQTLVDTYHEVTGDDRQAFTIGGGTYARHFERAAAFGPDGMDEDAPTWVGMEHGPDEGVSEQCLKRALVIYIASIARLMSLKY